MYHEVPIRGGRRVSLYTMKKMIGDIKTTMMNILRIENKSNGTKILSAFGTTPILKMIEDNIESANDWLVVLYENSTSVIPLDSWKAIDFFNKWKTVFYYNKPKTINCPDCFEGIVIDGASDAWGIDAFEETCTTCNGSGKVTV